MSIQQQNNQIDEVQSVEDCRDYLRTGRCKYGASCKYNHPPNVQNGGGMKAPLDPTEPLFPIRPNEPICQYYMKHGTCKFGQACKFHHPPHAAGQGGTNGQMLMNIVRQTESPQLVLNPVLADSNGQGLMLQLLPQRPDEPDCIYFLKNGRCKYGSTCRYHHPVSFQSQQQRMEKTRRQQVQIHDSQISPKVHYVTQVVHTYPNGQIIVSDSANPVTFINVEGFAQQGYQIISGSESIPQYSIPATVAPFVVEQGSSGSSLASFETANDILGEQHTHWYRSKRNDSTNNLSGTTNDSRAHNRVYMSHSTSEGNMARRIRSMSYGSVNDNSTYYDPVCAGLPRNSSVGSWRGDRNSAHDSVQRIVPHHQVTVMHDGKFTELRTAQTRSRPPSMSNPPRRIETVRRRNTRPGEHDEGFTMMTSALLNMLDTPEEVSGENFCEDEYIHSQGDNRFPSNGTVDSRVIDQLLIDKAPPGLSRSLSPPHHIQTSSSYHTMSDSASSMLQRLSLNNIDQDIVTNEISSWSPTWQGSLNGIHQEAAPPSMRSIMHHPHPNTNTPSSAHDSDIGLYLC